MSVPRLIAALGLLRALPNPLPAQLPEAPSPAAGVPRNQYVGDAACRPCHQETYRTYRGSAHHLSSRLPDASSVEASFTPGSNILRTSNPYFYFIMNAGKDGYFQTAVARFPPSDTISHQERIDLDIGWGRKGQTYLDWKNSDLFELPVTYWAETGEWMNSPGYPDGLPNFDKPIIPRCLECHATYIESLPQPLNHFNKASAVLGITCEKCHGPGKTHVEAERLHKAAGEREEISSTRQNSPGRGNSICVRCAMPDQGIPAHPHFPLFPEQTSQSISLYHTTRRTRRSTCMRTRSSY